MTCLEVLILIAVTRGHTHELFNLNDDLQNTHLHSHIHTHTHTHTHTNTHTRARTHARTRTHTHTHTTRGRYPFDQPPKLEDHPLSALRDWLFNKTSISGGCLLYSQPEDAPCHGDRDSHNTEKCNPLKGKMG